MAVIAGAIAKASDVNALTGLVGLQVSDSAPVSNTITLANTGIVIAMAANTTYSIDGFEYWDTGGGAVNIRLGLTYPAGCTGQWASNGPWASATPVAGIKAVNYIDTRAVSIANVVYGGSDGTGVRSSARPSGFITTSSTAGNLTLQFADEVATVTNLVVKAGSWLRLLKLS